MLFGKKSSVKKFARGLVVVSICLQSHTSCLVLKIFHLIEEQSIEDTGGGGPMQVSDFLTLIAVVLIWLALLLCWPIWGVYWTLIVALVALYAVIRANEG